MRRAAFLLLALALPSLAAEQWERLTTPNFELYTSAGEKKGRAAILHFEQVREFFLRASPVKNISDVPVRLIEFGTDGEFRKYGLNASAVAYYLPGAARDFIVMDEEKLRDLGTATHEYFHMVVRHSGMRLPIWLNEGWADVYSTLRPMKDEAAIGDLIPGRVAELGRDQWLDFTTLTSVTTASPIYNEADRVGIFYAESWALAHMLYLAPEYADNFGKFVTALNQGRSTNEACLIAWGKSGQEVFADLETYFKRKKLTGRVYQTRLTRDELEPTVEPVNDFDARVALAELLAATRRPADAKAAFKKLEAEKPDSAGVARSLGYIALQEQDVPTAIGYFEKAFEHGETDARMCFALAMMERDRRQKPQLVIAAFERALRTRPGYTDAAINLGVARVMLRDFPGAVAQLMSIPAVSPERAPLVFCNLSYAHMQTGDFPAARTDLETCRKYAKADADITRANAIGALIDARSKPSAAVHPNEKIQRVAGIAQSLECPSGPTGAARFSITTPGGPMVFDLPEPAAIESARRAVNPDPAFVLRCGQLKPAAITVEYAPPAPMTNSAGIVRYLEF
jgi:tetratricopeptide (TPR) repeat protein